MPASCCNIIAAYYRAFTLTCNNVAILPDTGPEDKKPDNIDLLIDKMKDCLTKEPGKFEEAMELFLQMEVHIATTTRSLL